MKKILVVLTIMFSCLLIVSCQSYLFEIYYFPIDMDFYVPPVHSDFKKNGINFSIKSRSMRNLFNSVSEQIGVEAFPEDYTGLRVLMIDSSNKKELFITSDKMVISLEEKKRFNVDNKIVEEILIELHNYVHKN